MSSAVTAIFCVIMDGRFNICSECQHQNSLDMWIEIIWSMLFVKWWSSVFMAKISNSKIFWRLVNNNWSKSRSVWKVRETKIYIYNHKSINGIKITVCTVTELHIKFLIMHKALCVLTESFSFADTFGNQIAFKPIATGSVIYESTHFESNRTSSMSQKIQTKHFLWPLKVSSSH